MNERKKGLERVFELAVKARQAMREVNQALDDLPETSPIRHQRLREHDAHMLMSEVIGELMAAGAVQIRLVYDR